MANELYFCNWGKYFLPGYCECTTSDTMLIALIILIEQLLQHHPQRQQSSLQVRELLLKPPFQIRELLLKPPLQIRELLLKPHPSTLSATPVMRALPSRQQGAPRVRRRRRRIGKSKSPMCASVGCVTWTRRSYRTPSGSVPADAAARCDGCTIAVFSGSSTSASRRAMWTSSSSRHKRRPRAWALCTSTCRSTYKNSRRRRSHRSRSHLQTSRELHLLFPHFPVLTICPEPLPGPELH